MTQRILVLRSDNIGDAIIFSGALRHVRARWPDAAIDLMVRPQVRELFEFCPHVNRVLSINRLVPWDHWRRHFLRGTWFLERTLLQPGMRRWWYPRADTVICPVSAPTEDILRAVRLTNARETFGYAGEQLRIPQFEDDGNRPEVVFTGYFMNTPQNRWLHEQERTRQLLETIGVKCPDMLPELWLSDADRRFAVDVVPSDGSLGLFIGAGSSWRQWPVAKWVALANRQEVSDRLVLFGSHLDRSMATDLKMTLAKTSCGVTDLVGRTSLRQLAAAMQRCRAVVSNDSCGLHLAVAGNVPAVGILGGYHFGRFYPWGNRRIHRVANIPMDCYYCNDVCLYSDWRCVRDVPVETVLRELQQAVEAD